MKTETLLVVLIGLVVVMGGVQAVQLGSLSQALSQGVAISTSAAPATAGVPKASALANLPTQVGGCG